MVSAETIARPNPRPNPVCVAERNTAPREYQIVHFSFGRLRVHLPSWTGKGEAAIETPLRRLTGVTKATANGLTGNVLILFNPRETAPEALIPELLAVPFDEERVAAPVPKVVQAPPPRVVVDAPKAEPAGYVTGTRRLLYRMLGWASVVMAIIGAILPGIPTAPFVILAGYFFIRSSPEAHQWLRESRWFGPILRHWEEHHAISPTARNVAIALILVGAVVATLLGLPLPLLLLVYAMQLVGIVIVLRLPVVEDAAGEVAPAGV
jgi:uncharacterized membrane protein YbaN (DUF454 family)